MKDVFGYELELGDEVAFYAPNYRDMITGIIIKFTPQQVRVEFKVRGHIDPHTYLNYPGNFAKKPENLNDS